MMKKVVVFALVAFIVVGAVSASDIKIGLMGIAGADNSGNKGALVGGGIDVAYDINQHFGVAIEADACGGNIMLDDGLKVKNNFYLSVPVMLYYRYDINKIELDAGAGFSTVFRNDSISVDLAGSLKATYWINDWGISLGATGILDCIPSLETKSNGDGTKTLQFKKASGEDSSILCSVGINYRFSPNKN